MRDRLSVLQAHFAASSSHLQHINSANSSIPSVPVINISDDVREALRNGRPVVALESTIVSHGMPFPQNLNTALEVEEIVRRNGAIPATIAILDGVPHVGLSGSQLEHIARRGRSVRKVSRRDLPYVMGRRVDGATTVSGTMVLAYRAGIRIFVTGGIGGVHRNAESTMDISADLTELGRTPVTVVCAGAKSVLDIPRTLEVLETQGVCVASYRCNEFPAFFSGTSGCKAPTRFDSPLEVAEAIAASLQLQLNTGMVVAVPIPEEHEELGREIEDAISRSLRELDNKKIQGNDVTPFLLQRITELTGGKSLEANIALIKNNAAIGAQVACELAEITK